MQARPIDHFGPVLEKQTWQTVLESCRSHGIEFVMQPHITNESTSEESGKFIVMDPAKNIIEFKFYANFEKTVEKRTV